MGTKAQGMERIEPMDDSPPSRASAEPFRRYRWYVLALLTLVYTIHYVDRSVINAVLEPIRREFALSDTQLGLLAGPAYAVAFAISGIPLGLLIDRVHRVRLLATLLTLWSGLTLLSGFAGNYTTLLLARMTVGAAEAGGSPTALSILSDYFPPRRRATATGIFFVSITLGIFGGYLASGIIASAHGWRAAFLVAGLPGLILALLLLATVREPARGRLDAHGDAAGPRPPLRAVLAVLLDSPALRWTLLGIIVAATVTAGLNAFLISLLVRRHGLGLPDAALVVSISVGLFGGAGSVLWGLVADRLSRTAPNAPSALMAVTMAAAAAFGLLGVLAHGLPLAIVGVAGSSFCISSFMGSGYGLLLNLSPPTMRGACAAVAQVSINLIGAGLGPLAVGALSSALAPRFGGDGLSPALAIVVSTTLVGAACHWVAGRNLRPSTTGALA
ncbi:spinster family MFS transporter [Sphingomonas sp. CJ20]